MKFIEFEKLYNKIKANQILLPDFQRDYVWLNKGYDLPFIRSILAKLPIGNFITIKSIDTKFACKELGFKNQSNLNNENIEYLLDGQQRLTTLMLVFSNLFFEKIKDSTHNFEDLLCDSMKRRYYLNLEKAEVFGLKFLSFDKKTLFTTEDLDKAIYYREFNETDENNEHPYIYNKLENIYKKDDFLEYYEKRCEIPLALLSNSDTIFELLLERIAATSAKNLKDKAKALGVSSFKQEFNFTECTDNDNFEIIDRYIDNRKIHWKNSIKNYLLSCLNLQINELHIEGNLARAIDVYESLNQGGVDLSTFDLVVARAAASTSHKEHFGDYILKRFSSYKNDRLFQILNSDYDFSDFDIIEKFGLLSKDQVLLPEVKTLILQLLSLIINTKKYHKIDIKYIKEKEQLNLEPNDIWENIDVTIDSLVAAFLLYKFKLGVTIFKKAQFKLLVLVVSYALYLLESKNFTEAIYIKNLNFIQGYYWAVIFKGKYKSDQNEVCVDELIELELYFNRNLKPSTLNTLNDILTTKEYNDFDTLCNYKGCKKTFSNSLLQFILATQNTHDILTKESLTSYDDQDLEIHHVIPISRAKTFKENKSQRGKDHILNSVLNLAFILKSSNKKISNLQPRDYLTDAYKYFYVENMFESSIISFDFSIDKDSLNDKYKVKYDNLLKAIKQEIERLIK